MQRQTDGRNGRMDGWTGEMRTRRVDDGSSASAAAYWQRVLLQRISERTSHVSAARKHARSRARNAVVSKIRQLVPMIRLRTRNKITNLSPFPSHICCPRLPGSVGERSPTTCQKAAQVRVSPIFQGGRKVIQRVSSSKCAAFLLLSRRCISGCQFLSCMSGIHSLRRRNWGIRER